MCNIVPKCYLTLTRFYQNLKILIGMKFHSEFPHFDKGFFCRLLHRWYLKSYQAHIFYRSDLHDRCTNWDHTNQPRVHRVNLDAGVAIKFHTARIIYVSIYSCASYWYDCYASKRYFIPTYKYTLYRILILL